MASVSLILSLTLILVINMLIVQSFQLMTHRARSSATLLTLTAIDTNTAAIFSQIQAGVNNALEEKVKAGKANAKFVNIVKGFLEEYSVTSMEAKLTPDIFKYQVTSFLKFVQDAMENPFKFEPGLHRSIRQPFDYYKWGNDFMRPLIITEKSRLVGLENVKQMIELTSKGENVIILANHQVSAQPNMYV